MAGKKGAQSVLTKIENAKGDFHCDLCSEDFESERGLDCHVRMSKAHKEGKFKCSVCSEVFAHEKGLSCHTRFSKSCNSAN